jgi:hypothetical protein
MMPTRQTDPSRIADQVSNSRKASEAKRKEEKAQKDRSILAFVQIPLTYNDDSRIEQKCLDCILDEIYLAFDGYTVDGTVKGAYKMKSTGQKRVEDSLKVSIVLRVQDRDKLESMASGWAFDFGQESIIVTYTDFEVVFVGPRNGDI